ncbi:sensor histidine kinase [Jatrophihabitans fulvus]
MSETATRSVRADGPDDPPESSPSSDPSRTDWVVVRDAGRPARDRRLPSLRAVLLRLGAAALVVTLAVAVVGLAISRRAAESEAVRDSAELTNVLADSVVQPALTDAMAGSAAAAAALGPVIRQRVLSLSDIVRVKIWNPDGEILWSDESRLVGARFALDADARATFSDPKVDAGISDLDEPENRYERGQGTLLEVHRPVWTPAGRPLLFEAYYRYDQVDQRASSIWRGFAAITLGSIGLLVLLLVPIGWTLVARARRAQRERERSLQRAADASLDERRRIAATLHDGVVQELVAASFAVGAGAQAASARGEAALADQLREAQDAVRSGIGGMRSLLVDLYPPSLHDAGLAAALRDTAAGLRIEHLDLAVDEDAAADLERDEVEAVFRVAQEALRNAARHAPGAPVTLTLHREDDDVLPVEVVVLEVADAGPGFDATDRPEGHFGLSLMDDVARDHGAELALRTAPGRGTAWRLRLPVSA